MPATRKAVEDLMMFIIKRHDIYLKRELNVPPPWTEDPILRNYRFCNVYREYDRVTKWIADQWRTPNAEDEDLWFGVCVARLLNQPESMKVLGYPVPWRPALFVDRLKKHKAKGGLVFNAAYIVSTNGIKKDKIEYLANDVLSPLWSQRKMMRPKIGDSLNSYHMLMIMNAHGFKSFMAAQVVADLKYVEPLHSAVDWHTFAASGPGSRRGLNFVMGRDPKDDWHEDEFRFELSRLRDALLPMFRDADMPEPHAQDIQNCLCEYSKYQRAKTTGQMPKQRYRWEM